MTLRAWFKAKIGGGWLRLLINRKLHMKYLKGKPAFDPAYKREVRAYWKPYTSRFDIHWHRHYANQTGVMDPRMIPNDLFMATMIPRLNRMDMCAGIRDKNYSQLLFPELAQPKTLARRVNGQWLDADYQLIDRARALALIEDQMEAVIKPSLGTSGGEGIAFWQADQGTAGLEAKLNAVGPNLIVQEKIVQHESLNRLHAESVNTVRIMSFVQGGRVHILSSVLRMGVGESRVDNFCAGGISAGIEADGRLKAQAYNQPGQVFDRHPGGGRFQDCVIPGFQDILEQIRTIHGRVGHFRLMSWDIALGEDGLPIFVEGNYWRGGIDIHQYCNGPLFGDLTEDLLKEVFQKG
jgi:hypothetical protein